MVMANATFDLKFERFKSVNNEEKLEIFKKSKAENTNRATDLWIKCFAQYLEEKCLPKVDDILTSDLPNILSDFYVEVKKKNRKPVVQESPRTQARRSLSRGNKNQLDEYKNSSLKCIHAALNRYFRHERGIDIISNELFIEANEMFRGVTKVARKEGRGNIEHKQAISEEDLKKQSNIFTKNMQGTPNAKALQQLILFNITYLMGCCGRENLCLMNIGTFDIVKDTDGRKFIHQIIDEHDKTTLKTILNQPMKQEFTNSQVKISFIKIILVDGTGHGDCYIIPIVIVCKLGK